MSDYILAAQGLEKEKSLGEIAKEIHEAESQEHDRLLKQIAEQADLTEKEKKAKEKKLPTARKEKTITSQLSYTISGFSETLRVPLTKRVGNSLKLTDAGRDFLETLLNSRRNIDLFFVVHSESIPPFEIKFGASDTVLEWVIIPFLDRIDSPTAKLLNNLQHIREFVDWDINIELEELDDAGEMIAKLYRAELDFALFRSNIPPKNTYDRLESVEIGNVSYRIIVPQPLLDAAKEAAPDPFPLSVLSNVGEFDIADAEIETNLAKQTGLTNIRTRVRRRDHSFQRLFSVFNRFKNHAAVFPNIVPVQQGKISEFQSFELSSLKSSEKPLWLVYNKNAFGHAIDLHYSSRAEGTASLAHEFATCLAKTFSESFDQ